MTNPPFEPKVGDVAMFGKSPVLVTALFKNGAGTENAWIVHLIGGKTDWIHPSHLKPLEYFNQEKAQQRVEWSVDEVLDELKKARKQAMKIVEGIDKAVAIIKEQS